MIESFFQEQKSHLDYFFQNIDIDRTEKIFKKLVACKGTIIFSGVGKSGIIAHKLAMTMLSTGTKAMYIPATDAMHGDLGMVGPDDIVVFLSKSGHTRELVDLLLSVKKKGAYSISLVSNEESPLFKKCDLSISLPIPKELCPFDLAPTTSTEVQLIFGDVLAVAMMKKKEFTLRQYALNHPAGSIGKKITLKVEDIMLSDERVPLAAPDSKLLDNLFELSEKKCGCLLVHDEGKLLGIFTDGDLRRAIQNGGGKALEMKLSDVMVKDPRTVSREMLAMDALRRMEENPQQLITVFPVLEKDQIVGVIRMHDILQLGV